MDSVQSNAVVASMQRVRLNVVTNDPDDVVFLNAVVIAALYCSARSRFAGVRL